MEWSIVYHRAFAEWLAAVKNSEPELHDELMSHLVRLAEFGPSLGRPSVDTLKDSNLSNLKELRVQFKGDPYRVFFVFDPERKAVLLVGGSKKGQNQKRWYKENIEIAETRYKQHLEMMENETKKRIKRLERKQKN